MRHAPLLAFLALPAAVVPRLARADDGFLDYGGTPRLLSRHPSVRMARETVVVDVLPQGYRVEATFVFRNDGPACAVRMGFPDRGGGGPGFEERMDAARREGTPLPIGTSLRGFASSVDGVRVATTLVRGAEVAESWHAKTVRFASGQTRIVRVRYEADAGGATSSGPGYLRELDYVLHTGASWKGPIGYAAVLVRFPPGVRKGPIRLVSARSLRARSSRVTSPYDLTDWERRPAGTVVWQGPSRPRLRGKGLLFVRRGFEPRRRDDVVLWFGFPHRYPWQDEGARRGESPVIGTGYLGRHDSCYGLLRKQPLDKTTRVSLPIS